MNPYEVTFYERQRPARQTTVLLGDTPPTPSSGGGGHTSVPLPKRGAVSIWTGGTDLILSIPIVLIGDETLQGPVFPERTALTAMWRPKSRLEEPPVIKVRAAGDAVPYQNLAYTITDLAWGSSSTGAVGDAIGDAQARRVMQKLLVTLTEYNADERLQTSRMSTDPGKGRATRYTVRKGDTLKALAKRFDLTWQDLGEAQHPPIRDPRKIKAGQVLTIPFAHGTLTGPQVAQR